MSLKGIPGHADYRIVEVSPNNDGYQCQCGWTSDGYHDMTSYAYFDWLRHVEEMRRKGD
jgi:hypothetical protein